MSPSRVQDTPVAESTSSACHSHTQTSDAFHNLVKNLSKILGPSSGLVSEDVDIKHLQDLMEKYISDESEWGKYAFEDSSRGYTRNLVDEGNGKSNLVRHT